MQAIEHTPKHTHTRFAPFARAYGDQPAPELSRMTGEALSLRAGGLAEQEAFRVEVR